MWSICKTRLLWGSNKPAQVQNIYLHFGHVKDEVDSFISLGYWIKGTDVLSEWLYSLDRLLRSLTKHMKYS